MRVHDSSNLCSRSRCGARVHLTRCLRTLRAAARGAFSGTSGGRARCARRALVRVSAREEMTVGCKPTNQSPSRGARAEIYWFSNKQGEEPRSPATNQCLRTLLQCSGTAALCMGVSPNQVLTHAARAAAKQLNKVPFQAPLVAARVTMRAWPVARSIFDAPLERSERGDNKLDNRARRARKAQGLWLEQIASDMTMGWLKSAALRALCQRY